MPRVKKMLSVFFSMFSMLPAMAEEMREEIIKHPNTPHYPTTHAVLTSSSEEEENINFASSADYDIEHCLMMDNLICDDWQLRGTLHVPAFSGGDEHFSAKYSDAENFQKEEKRAIVKICRDYSQKKRTEAKINNENLSLSTYFYSIRLKLPDDQGHLQSSIPLDILADGAVNGYDVFGISLGANGIPTAISYYVKPQMKKRVFINPVAIAIRDGRSPIPVVPPVVQGQSGKGKVKEDGTPVAEEQSFLRKYWWAILLGLVLLSSGGGGDPEAAEQEGKGTAAPKK